MKQEKIYAILRDDPYKRKTVVDEATFWGDGRETRVYLDYKDIPNRKIAVTHGLKGNKLLKVMKDM